VDLADGDDMVVPLVALAMLALVVIKSLMGVVAHEGPASVPTSLASQATPALGAWSDDSRTILLPASAEHEADAVTETKAR
jgi:hypothetical protein